MRILFTLTLILALLGCSEKATPEVTPRISPPGEPLVFLTHPTDPPCSYVDEKGECAGTDIELARKIAAKMGRPLVCEMVSFEEIIPRLKSDTADFGIATMAITEARAQDVDFSAPYGVGGNCFLYRADGIKPRMSQLASLRIAVEAGSTGDLYLCHHGGDPIRFTVMTEAVESLENGHVDAVFHDEIPVRAWVSTSKDKYIASPLETRELYGVAVNKRRPDVLSAANDVLTEGGAK